MKKVTEDLKWKNIDHEKYRVYRFPDGNHIQIDNPLLLNVSSSGGHRILDANDISHYIPSGWIHLFWETTEPKTLTFPGP